MDNFEKYRRTQIAELRPVTRHEKCYPEVLRDNGISISAEDLKNGSPKKGDMIARNPKNRNDQWLVAEQYFKDNFEPIFSKPTNEFTEYQRKAVKLAIYPSQYSVIYPALGLAGEAGEVADKVKKVIRDDDGIVSIEARQELAMELGDVLWYIANIANDLDIALEAGAELNISKLHSRRERNTLKGNGDNR